MHAVAMRICGGCFSKVTGCKIKTAANSGMFMRDGCCHGTGGPVLVSLRKASVIGKMGGKAFSKRDNKVVGTFKGICTRGSSGFGLIARGRSTADFSYCRTRAHSRIIPTSCMALSNNASCGGFSASGDGVCACATSTTASIPNVIAKRCNTKHVRRNSFR